MTRRFSGQLLIRLQRVVFLTLFIVSSVAIQSTFAETSERSINALVESFPETSEVNGRVLSAGNAQEYKSLIVPELYSYVRSGALELRAFRKLAAKSEPQPIEEGENDSIDLILRRAANPFGHEAIADTNFSLLAIKEGRLVRQLLGRLVRIQPTLLNSDDKTGQLYREVVRINQPQGVFGFSWLTFRFDSSAEDVFWLYSPANKKSRQLTGSNRTDGFMHSAVSLDDFYGWSGKPELVSGYAISKQVGLVYFSSLEPLQVSQRNQCDHYESELYDGEQGAAPESRWAFGSRKLPQAAAWAPTDSFVFPRKLYRVELQSRDPYSLYGRQIVYIDRATAQTVYKFVYDKTGKPLKFVIQALGLLARDATKVQSYPAFTLIDDLRTGDGYIVDTSRIALCKNFPDDISLTDFDPRRLGNWATPEAVVVEPSATPEETPQEELQNVED